VQQLAERTEQKPAKVRRELERSGALEAVRSDVARGKALEFLVDHATVLDEGGSVVAFTFLNAAGERGQHGFTGTVREHRGCGLATAAKGRALRAAAERGVTRVTTSNAEENAAMRAINRNLGFEPIGEHVIFGRDL
jgi:RimJ/RimL family protein N-acetyltransferase